jgi:hypothetical protein
MEHSPGIDKIKTPIFKGQTLGVGDLDVGLQTLDLQSALHQLHGTRR